MIALLGCALGAGLVLVAAPWLWPASRRRAAADQRAGALTTRAIALLELGGVRARRAPRARQRYDRLRPRRGRRSMAGDHGRPARRAVGGRRSRGDDMIEFSRRAGAATAASILRSQAQLDLLASGKSSDLVVEVLHGRLDEKRTPANAEEWEHVFPKAAVTVIDDCRGLFSALGGAEPGGRGRSPCRRGLAADGRLSRGQWCGVQLRL